MPDRFRNGFHKAFLNSGAQQPIAENPKSEGFA